jgi:hypothetical protein
MKNVAIAAIALSFVAALAHADGSENARRNREATRHYAAAQTQQDQAASAEQTTPPSPYVRQLNEQGHH